MPFHCRIFLSSIVSKQQFIIMKTETSGNLQNGDQCKVIGGTHKGKSGTVSDLHTSKTGHLTITVTQQNGVRFKTLAQNVTVQTP